MYLRAVTITIALVATLAVANAAECTNAQRREVQTLEEDSAMDAACLHSDDITFNVDKIDPQLWARASPCRNATCVSFLQAQVIKVPDCNVERVNMKSFFAAKFVLCVELASGTLSPNEIKQRMDNLSGSA